MNVSNLFDAARDETREVTRFTRHAAFIGAREHESATLEIEQARGSDFYVATLRASYGEIAGHSRAYEHFAVASTIGDAVDALQKHFDYWYGTGRYAPPVTDADRAWGVAEAKRLGVGDGEVGCVP